MNFVDGSALLCHCRQVTYDTVSVAIDSGARSLADVQNRTFACTRCFGCRFEVEALLRDRLADAYVETEFVARVANEPARSRKWFRPLQRSAAPLPRRMYMPALIDAAEARVDTRVVVFNWNGGDDVRAVDIRADLLALDGRRVGVRYATVDPGASVVIDVRELANGDPLTRGVGTVKLVVDRDSLHSLRPYFQFMSSGGITSTHEKAGTAHPREIAQRPFHWSFPVGYSRTPQEAFFFLVNTQERPMRDQKLVWRSVDGDDTAIQLDEIGLDQGAIVALHEHAPEIATGQVAGTIRLTPALHKIAGFIVRYDRAGDRWRVQHL